MKCGSTSRTSGKHGWRTTQANGFVSSAAFLALDEIWLWNSRNRGVEHAHKYITFLRAEITQLETMFFLAKPVPTRPRLSYAVIRRRKKGQGHVVVRSGRSLGIVRTSSVIFAMCWFSDGVGIFEITPEAVR